MTRYLKPLNLLTSNINTSIILVMALYSSVYPFMIGKMKNAYWIICLWNSAALGMIWSLIPLNNSTPPKKKFCPPKIVSYLPWKTFKKKFPRFGGVLLSCSTGDIYIYCGGICSLNISEVVQTKACLKNWIWQKKIVLQNKSVGCGIINKRLGMLSVKNP